jgi:Flp pilus assembly protein TadG
MPPPLLARCEEGQVLILFALAVVAILAGMTLVFDVGDQLIQRRMAQDGADSAALAGGHALAEGQSTTQIRDVITSYAGGVSGPFGASAITVVTAYYVDAADTNLGSVGQTMPNPGPAGVHVEVSRKIPATFSNFLGIGSFTATGVATGATATGPVDIMLALDTTGSMGTAGFAAEQKAVHDFVIAMKLKPGDANSVRIGLARFQGAVCSDDSNHRSGDNSTHCNASPTPWDDATILSQLTDDPDTLLTIACGNVTSGTNNCLTNNVMDYTSIVCSSLLLPTPLGLDGETILSSPSGHVTPLGCPLNYMGASPDCNCLPAAWFEVEGTKLANAFNVMQGKLAGQASNNYWAWSDASRPTARKVLIMMTDGQDNSGPGQTPATNIVQAAAALKTNANGDVTIYTIGYYSLGESAIANAGSYPYPCIGSTFPASVSATDQLMHDLSSSTATDCQYYAPMKKSDLSLPAAFVKIAGKIQQGRLTR